MKQINYPHSIHAGTLEGLPLEDQEVIRDWCRKGYWSLVDSNGKTKINP